MIWWHSPQCAECDHVGGRSWRWPWRRHAAPQSWWSEQDSSVQIEEAIAKASLRRGGGEPCAWCQQVRRRKDFIPREAAKCGSAVRHHVGLPKPAIDELRGARTPLTGPRCPHRQAWLHLDHVQSRNIAMVSIGLRCCGLAAHKGADAPRPATWFRRVSGRGDRRIKHERCVCPRPTSSAPAAHPRRLSAENDAARAKSARAATGPGGGGRARPCRGQARTSACALVDSASAS